MLRPFRASPYQTTPSRISAANAAIKAREFASMLASIQKANPNLSAALSVMDRIAGVQQKLAEGAKGLKEDVQIGKITDTAAQERLTKLNFEAEASIKGLRTEAEKPITGYIREAEIGTRPTDRLSNQPFAGTLQKAIRLDRSIVNGGRIGQVTIGWGDIELINAEGNYDALINRFAVDGRRVVVRVGTSAIAYDAFVTLFDGTASDWQVEEDVLRIQVRDNTYRLEVPAQPQIYGGY